MATGGRGDGEEKVKRAGGGESAREWRKGGEEGGNTYGGSGGGGEGRGQLPWAAFAHSTASPSGGNVGRTRAPLPGPAPTHTKLFMNGRKLSLKLRIE